MLVLWVSAGTLACGGMAVVDPDSVTGSGSGGSGGNTTTTTSTGIGGSTSTGTGTATGTAAGGTGGEGGSYPPVPNDHCDTAIDITGGATVFGTTCGADVTYTSNGNCGPLVSPDVFYVIDHPEGTQWSYSYVLTAQFHILTTTEATDCLAPTGCHMTMEGTLQGNGKRFYGVRHYLGECGTFTLTVTPE